WQRQTSPEQTRSRWSRRHYPGRAEGCDLQPVTAEPPITLSYATSTVPRGCVSSSSVGSSHEVHILRVEWSKVTFPLKVSVTPQAGSCAPSPVLILLCARCSAIITSPCPDLIVHTVSAAAPHQEQPRGALLAWARDTYRGITSYSELRDPRWVQVRLGEATDSPRDCIPQERFNATPHLETEVFFYGVKGCSRGDTQSTRAAHIIRLQPEPSSPITEVNLSLSCPERAVSNQILILQSRANLTWCLSVNNCHIQFLVSGNYKIMSISAMLFPGELLPDTEWGLVAKAFEKNYSVIASYSAIPASTRVSLEIQEHGEAPVGTMDPDRGDHLADPTFSTFWQLILNLAKGAAPRSVRVAFECKIPRELFLRLFPTAAFEAPQTELEVNKEAFVQASMRWEDHPSDLQLKECWLGAPGRESVLLVQGGEARGKGVTMLEGPPSSHGRKVWRFRFTYAIPEGGRVPLSTTLKCNAGLQNNTIFEKVLEVTVKDSWRPPNNHGLGLAAVLGITFGAFLIGALLTAGLWYIYSHTRPTSKLQPVSSTAPASESSSTNHSIGSTQSTPCSTSSMA
uniref:Endoglin n=1 Tax=Buteo japonicus TaxID=224669 RepID=A0A8C0BLZ3_9AVES